MIIGIKWREPRPRKIRLRDAGWTYNRKERALKWKSVRNDRIMSGAVDRSMPIGVKGISTMRRIRPFILLASGVLGIAFAVSHHASPVLRSIQFRDDFEAGSLEVWDFPFSEDWVIRGEPGNHFLHMLRNREPGVPRRPLQFARLRNMNVGSFKMEARVRRESTSLIVVFNYVDTLHFYYAHLSADRGTQQPVHNGLFIVNGEPRERIAGADADPALPDQGWHKVRIERSAPSGSVEVFIDDEKQPRFSVVDRTFNCGQVGIGSFDETGDFDDVKLTSDDAGCAPGAMIRPANAP